MKEFIFVFGSDDGELISNSHFGDSRKFYIYKLKENTDFEFLRSIENTVRDIGHGLSNKMKQVLELIGDDIDVLLVRKESINLLNIAKKTKYQPILIDIETKDDLFTLLITNFQICMDLIEKRQLGEREAFLLHL